MGTASLGAAWTATAVACTGLGLLWYRLFGVRRLDPDRLFMAFWLGLGLSLGFLQLWHFALPVTPAAAALLLAGGSASLLWQRRAVAGALGSPRRWLPSALLLLLVFLWTANRCMRALEHYDTGLYLLGGMRWLSHFPLVPGLGNLHGRFAFNNANLLFAALFDFGPWVDRVPNIVNGSLLTVFLTQMLVAGWRGWRAPAHRAQAVFALVAIVPALLMARRYDVSLSTDLPVTLLGLIVAWRAFRMLTDETRARRVDLFDVSLLAATAVCVKLSAIVFLLLVWLCAAGAALRAGGIQRRDLAVAVGLGAALLLPWLIRGLVLSGYPLYPSPLLSLPVDWQVPAWSVAKEAAGVRSWARSPGAPPELVLEGLYWLPTWLERNLPLRVDVGFPLPTLVCTAGLLAAAAAGSLGRRTNATRGLVLLAPATAGFAFWFWSAPDPRFAMFVFWTFAATGVAVAAGSWERVGPLPAPLAAALLVAALALAALPKGLVRPGPDRGFHPVPAVRTEPFTTDSGLVLAVPIGTDRCWGSGPLCTAYPRAQVRLRRPGDLRAGFAHGVPSRDGAGARKAPS